MQALFRPKDKFNSVSANVYALKEESRPEKNNSALSSEPIDHGILTSAFQ